MAAGTMMAGIGCGSLLLILMDFLYLISTLPIIMVLRICMYGLPIPCLPVVEWAILSKDLSTHKRQYVNIMEWLAGYRPASGMTQNTAKRTRTRNNSTQTVTQSQFWW
ncbi:hypothetical protein AYL99_11679 [Fonsecaea erecta]|uniref:Uncharacterized protein n=1 Tax=Fonsecaea erecta TaxID=1367422 RepID=A0A178Z375_9EURO|nr:hypothetical protein AYL99_11679 [Fonsecaea erecta]OAP54144.1 hypothetical protein AYL99_11679 [Fonsecaea erecta]